MNTTAIIIWIAAAAILTAWIVLLINTVVKYERPNVFKYKAPVECDERQQAMRGTAFTYGFLTVMAYFVFWILTAALEVTLFTPVAGVMIGLVAGLTPTIVILILSDAYFYIGEKISIKIVILNFPLIGWLLFMFKMDWSAVVQNGIVTEEIFFPLLCALYLLIDVLLIIRFVQEKKEKSAQ